MVKALQYTSTVDGVTLPVMTEGSQMVVITDHRSKNTAIERDVITLANDKQVCIHFFISGTAATSDGVYQRVADGTTGTLIESLSSWSLATFTLSYRTSPCSFEVVERKKRLSILPYSCGTFTISELAILFRFSGDTSSNVTLTRPSGSTITVSPTTGAAVHSERYPEHGEWSACLSSGSLTFRVDQDFSLDVTLRYLKELESGTPIASIYPPTECSTGRVMLTSRKTSLLQRPRLSLVNSERSTVQEAPLINCSNALIANMSFPRGEYTYLLTGEDRAGVPISYRINKKVLFLEGEYELTANGGPIEIERSDTFNFSISISNQNSYASRFTFSMDATGFVGLVEPSSVLVQPRETADVRVTSWVSSSLIQSGSPNVITVEAANGCATLTATQTVTIKSAGTPPPADVCGCQNGGTCVVQTRRGREFRRCACPTGFSGRTCQRATLT